MGIWVYTFIGYKDIISVSVYGYVGRYVLIWIKNLKLVYECIGIWVCAFISIRMHRYMSE